MKESKVDILNVKNIMSVNYSHPVNLTIFKILKSFFTFGNLTCTIPFKFSSNGNATVKESLHKSWKVLILILQISSMFHLICLPPYVHTRLENQNQKVSKWLSTIRLSSQGVWTAVFYVCIWSSRKKWKQIVEGFLEVEKEFRTLGIRPLSNLTHRIIQAYLIFLYGFGIYGFVSIFRINLFQLTTSGIPAMIPRADDFYSHVFGHIDTTRITFQNVLEVSQVVFGKFFNLQAVSFSLGFFSIISFILQDMYKRLNESLMMERGFENSVVSLEQGMSLHRRLTQIMDTLNSAVSLPFVLFVVDFIIQACNFLSKILTYDDSLFKGMTLYATILHVNLTITLLILASVNHNAKRALEWFEIEGNLKATKELNPNNLTSFSNRITFGEIGFNGMGFFVVTKSFVVTVASGILTYVIIIAQLHK